jgi:hypothetical protein
MREKVERGALGGNRLPRASEVRLTEFDPSRSDGYVRRLDREAISFFFTNFPEEVLGGDLWKMFARFGRVGEVYIPQKLNKWGCRFGFVKYMEVKDVSVLERKQGRSYVRSPAGRCPHFPFYFLTTILLYICSYSTNICSVY